MSKKIRTIHLLLLDPSSNEAEHTINLLRNNGFAVRATQIVNEDDLKNALERQEWDLLIAKPAIDEFTAEKALRIIQHLQRDIPVLLQTDKYSSESVVEALRLGMCDVVPIDEEERLRLVVAREFAHVDDRHQLLQAQSSLRDIEKRCDLLLASSRDAIAYIHDGMHIYANRAYVELFGYDDGDELASMPVMDLIAHDMQVAFRDFLREYAADPSHNEFTCRGLHADGEMFDAVLSLSAAKYDGEECTQVYIRRGTDNAELEKRLKELSAIDPQTGLFNRQHMMEQLQLASQRAIKRIGMSALMLMEIDQFNQIKSKYGLASTDQLMRDIADFMRRQLDDSVLLARVADDGFAVLSPINKASETREFGEKICHDFATHMFEVEHHTVKCTFSAGAIPISEDAADAEMLMSNAHAALVMAKQKGGNACKLFDPILLSGSPEVDKKVLMAVQEALDTGRAYLLYQPVIKMHGAPGSIYSVLLRVKDEKDNYVSPETIFPIAEQSGLAAKLDRWVITQATKALANFKGKDRPKLMINLSGAALIEDSLPSFIGQCLRTSRLSPDALVFQISEQEAWDHLKRCLNFLEGLRKVQGLSCLNTYGSTEHSLQLVKELPIDFVRFDGRFAPQLATNQESLLQLKSLLESAHHAGRKSIIPRVEDAGCLAKLWPIGVHYVQGYYLQPPSENMDYDFSANEF